MNPSSDPPTPPPTPPAAPAGLRPDTSAYHWLGLPVAWTDLQGRLLGANPAFEAATGHRADAAQAQRLTDHPVTAAMLANAETRCYAGDQLLP